MLAGFSSSTPWSYWIDTFLRVIYAFSRSAASKPHQASPAHARPSQLVGKYPYLALHEGLPYALEVVTHTKTPEILGGSGSKTLLEHLPLYLLRNQKIRTK